MQVWLITYREVEVKKEALWALSIKRQRGSFWLVTTPDYKHH